MKKWIIGLGTFLLAVALAILGRDGRQLKRVEARRDEELASRTKAGQLKAEKLNKKAEAHKAAAAEAAARTEAILEERSEKDPDMGSLLSDWRVRKQPGRDT